MLRPRIIPVLLVHKKGLFKTVKFGSPRYVGDPINAVRIFNEKGVDELMVLDIDATRNGTPIDFALVEKLADECRMPLCYGGGVKSVQDAMHLINLGAEKVAISSALISDPRLASRISDAVGAQSVVGVADVKKEDVGGSTRYAVVTHNGTRRTDWSIQDFIANCQANGVGEIVVNSVDNDGTYAGYDLDLAGLVRSNTSVPITMLGGCSNYQDFHRLFSAYGIMGGAAGSIFVFKGALKAVLINYPNEVERKRIAVSSIACPTL